MYQLEKYLPSITKITKKSKQISQTFKHLRLLVEMTMNFISNLEIL